MGSAHPEGAQGARAPAFLQPKAPDLGAALDPGSAWGKRAGERAACVKREWRDVVGTAKALGMYDVKVLSIAVGQYTPAVTAPNGIVFACAA
jgi:hypothetical protein